MPADNVTDPLRPATLAVLVALAAAERDDGPCPSLSMLAATCGMTGNGAVRYELLTLSDRRLIDGHGTARRLTDAGRAALAAGDAA